jgi:hypothetical protein
MKFIVIMRLIPWIHSQGSKTVLLSLLTQIGKTYAVVVCRYQYELIQC